MAVPGQGRDAIALAHAEIAQHAGQTKRPRGELGVGVAEQRLAGPACGQGLAREDAAAALEELRERQRVIHHEVVDRRAHQ
jgi:hypothetical protein